MLPTMALCSKSRSSWASISYSASFRCTGACGHKRGQGELLSPNSEPGGAVHVCRSSLAERRRSGERGRDA